MNTRGMPKQSILTIFVLLFTLIAKSQSTCSEIENKISIAKENIDKGDDGLMCPNAVQFYTNLHTYQCEPLTHEEGIKLKKELEVMKRIYNEYEMWCEDIGEIKDPIPDIPAITLDLETNNENSESSNQENLDNNSLSTNLNSILGGTSDGKSGDCSYAALNKFGSDAWSTKAGEDAAVQYEGYRCHCLNGTLPDGFTDPSFDPKPNDLDKALVQIKGLRDRYLNLKSPSDPQPSPLPQKCRANSSSSNQGNSDNLSTKQRLGNMLVGGELSDLTSGFIHGLAEGTDSEKLKKLSQEVAEIQKKYGAARDFNNQISGAFGLNPADNQAMQMYEVAQAIEISVSIVKTIFGETELSQSQNQVLKAIRINKKNIKLLYDEINDDIQVNRNIGLSDIKRLYEMEERFEQYEAFTAVDRYIYYWYLLCDDYPDVSDYQIEINRINKLTLSELLNEIEIKKKTLNELYDYKEPAFMSNSEEAFRDSYKKIELIKALYYNSINEKEISSFYVNKYIGKKLFNRDETIDQIIEYLKQYPNSLGACKVTEFDEKILIENFEKRGDPGECYYIPLNEEEFVMNITEEYTNTYFAQIGFKNSSNQHYFESCEDGLKYKKVYILKMEGFKAIANEVFTGLNRIVRSHKINELLRDKNYIKGIPVLEEKIKYERSLVYNDQTNETDIRERTYISDGYKVDMNSSGKFAYMDINGNVLTPYKYDAVFPFKNGFGKVAIDNGEKGYLHGFVNEQGVEIVKPQYTIAEDFSNGLAKVQNIDASNNYSTKGIGFINAKGQLIIPMQYHATGKFSEGICNVTTMDFKEGFIDRNGNKISSFQYNECRPFSQGRGAFLYNYKWGFIDKNGKEVIPNIYDQVSSFSNGISKVRIGKKIGYINRLGEVVIPIEYKYHALGKDGVIKLRKREKDEWIVFTKEGRLYEGSLPSQGETLLHKGVKDIINSDGSLRSTVSQLETYWNYGDSGIDQTAVNNDGLTAWELFLENEKNIEKKFKKYCKESEYCRFPNDRWKEYFNDIAKCLHPQPSTVYK